MRILFIKLRHIGDSLLLTPTIVATKGKFPNAEIWVLVRRTCESILVGCPEIDRILTTAQPESGARSAGDVWTDARLVLELATTPFDFVFELGDNDRGRWIALIARTGKRCANVHRNLKPIWKPLFHHLCTRPRWPKHHVVRDYDCPQEVLGLPESPPPLRFAVERTVQWAGGNALTAQGYAVIHFTTRWPKKAWPTDRWLVLARNLLDIVPQLVISCGPAPEEIAEARLLVQALPQGVVSTDGGTSWAQLAGLLLHARFFVGVDTAAMHLAAAMGTPCVCLFGPSNAFEFHPWNVPYWMLQPPEGSQLEPERSMQSIREEDVLAACRLAAGNIKQ